MRISKQRKLRKQIRLATFNQSAVTMFLNLLLRRTGLVTNKNVTAIATTIALSACSIFLISCAQQNTPLQPVLGCEHVSLDDFLPGITTKEKSYRREQQRNDKKLVPGQKVSDFSLVDLDGEKVSLFDVLQEKNTVLIDFWASWCGPCVASFPKLKELRANHGQDGFEVVAISIDSTHEEWAEGSEKYEIPWINLGELESWDGEVATLYGVHFIPKSYLIDSEGCILQKDLPIDLLEKVVVSRFDKADSEESSLQTDGE